MTDEFKKQLAACIEAKLAPISTLMAEKITEAETAIIAEGFDEKQVRSFFDYKRVESDLSLEKFGAELFRKAIDAKAAANGNGGAA